MAQINIRVEDEIKDKAEAFLNELGFTFSSAFNVFIRQAMREQRIPFTIDLRVNDEQAEYVLTKSELVARAADMDHNRNTRERLLLEADHA